MENQTLFLEAYDKMERWLAMPTLSPKLKRELQTLSAFGKEFRRQRGQRGFL